MSFIIFSTQQYEYMKIKMLNTADGWGDIAGCVERKTFPDGERYQRIVSGVSGQNVMLVGGTVSDSDTLELYDLACALVKFGADSLTIVIPYFGYSTMERSTKTGEVVTAKTRARLLSSIPSARNGNRVFLLDMHSEGIPHYFEGDIRPVHIYAKDVTKKMIRDFGETDYVLASTDAGRAKWVESLANDLGVPASFVFKKRLSGDETEITAVNAQVSGKKVVIYDDMLRTGGSMVGAAKAYKDAGAASIFVVVTHAVLPTGIERLFSSGLIEAFACTDSHHSTAKFVGTGKLKVSSVSKLLLNKVHETP